MMTDRLLDLLDQLDRLYDKIGDATTLDDWKGAREIAMGWARSNGEELSRSCRNAVVMVRLLEKERDEYALLAQHRQDMLENVTNGVVEAMTIIRDTNARLLTITERLRTAALISANPSGEA
jgi:hypothetical protein